jgi:hypothetical protein
MVPLRLVPHQKILPYSEIAHEVAARLIAGRNGADPLAPWAEEVIVPSRGVAEAITAELLARMPNGIASLRLQTLEELATRLLATAGQAPRVASDAERRLAMRVAIRAIDHPMMESRGIASMLERAYRDVRDSGFTLAQMARRVGKTRGLRNVRRTEAILAAWGGYERFIAQVNAIDAADRLADAARLVDGRTPMQLLAGFYDMTGAQLRLVEALLHAGRIGGIWVPTDEAFAQPLIVALGKSVARAAPLPIPLPPPGERGLRPRGARSLSPLPGRGERDRERGGSCDTVALLQYDTRIDELRDVCARVAALLAEETPAREIGIVARSLEPYDVRLLNRFAAEHGFRTTLGDETPLAAHRIGRAAVTLLRLREHGFPRAEVLELVRGGLHVKTRIDVDAADAATRRARIAGGTSAELRPVHNRARIIDEYIDLVAELEELTGTIDLDLVTRLGSLFRIDTEADLVAASKLDEIGAVFQRAAAWLPVEASYVIDAIEQEAVPHANRAGLPRIWAGDVMRFRGRSFSHLFVVRMQDDIFPQRRTEDPLLPDSDRRLLGLREIGDGREEEQLLFSLLDAPQVQFSFATGDGFGKVLRLSRYVRHCHPERSEGPGREGRDERASRRPLQLLAKAGTRSVFDGYLGPLSAELRAKLSAVSPTMLEDFGECPQKFLLKHLLGAVDIDQPEREIQIHHREKGTLDHKILERHYREGGDRLDQIIDEQFDLFAQQVPPFNRVIRDIERRATKRILREFLNVDSADLEAQDLVPRWFEYRFGASRRRDVNAPPPDHPEPFMVEAGGIPVRVEGTIDRIDVARDASQQRFRIVDYKSGKALRHHGLAEKIDRGVRLQLALYAMAVSEFFDAAPDTVSATIKPIVTGDAKAERFAFALHEKKDGLLETLEIFMRAILGGQFPAFPNDNDAEFNSCKYCPVNHSCRTRHDLDERYAVQQLRDPRTLLSGAAE